MLRFFRETKGNVAMFFALATIPLVMVAVIGIEFSREQGHERETLAALDSTVLAAAVKRQQLDISDAELANFAQSYFEGNISAPENINYDRLEISARDEELTISVTGRMPSAMIGIFGKDFLEFSVSSSAVYGERSELEVVLVLDVSNSMSGARIAALRVAASGLIDNVLQSGNADIRLGIVPFNEYVNVGLDNRDAFWMDAPDDTSSTMEVCPVDEAASEAIGCTFETVCDQDGVFGGGSEGCSTVRTCPTGIDPVREECSDVTINRIWNGCVGSRTRPLNHQDTDFSSSPVHGLLLQDSRPCFAENEVVELTDDATVLQAAIQDLEVGGATYMAPGMAWGLRTLSPNAPFGGGQLHTVAGGQVLILLSDGANTRTFPDDDFEHTSDDVEQANEDTLNACEAVKAIDIEVFTIDFGIDDAETEALLRDCATSEDHALEADSASQLIAVFNDVTARLQTVALSR